MSAALASDAIYRELRRRIVFAELLPGAEIDVEQYAHEFHSSRTPVRDALRHLSHDGLVDVHPRAGCRVSRVSMKDLVDALDVREATSPVISRLAAVRATPAEIDELEVIAEGEYLGAENNVHTLLSASHLFHCRVAKLSHNQRLHEITEHVLEDLERVMRLCGQEPAGSPPAAGRPPPADRRLPRPGRRGRGSDRPRTHPAQPQPADRPGDQHPGAFRARRRSGPDGRPVAPQFTPAGPSSS